MAYTLQQLSDLEDIRTLKHRYFRGIDTADLALLGTLFTPDLTVDYRGGTYRVRLEGRDNMLEFLANSFHSGAVAMHHGHMPEIDIISPTEARGVWAMEALVEAGNSSFHGFGHYWETYRKEGGEWRIAKLLITRLRFEQLSRLAKR